MYKDLNDVYYFAKSVEHGGFAPAGRALGIPKSKLSRRVSQLEERLGLRLVHRSTRTFVVTEAGQRYYEHCRAILVEIEAAQMAMDEIHKAPCGIIKMTCPVGLLNFHVGRMMAEFMVKYPKVTVHLEATNRRVDVLAEGVDVALRVRPLPLDDSELALRVLSDRGQAIVASPELIARCGMPICPEELTRFPSMCRSTAYENHSWTLLHEGEQQKIIIHHTPRYCTTDMFALKEAALAGAGIVQLPLLMLGEELAAGKLIKLLPEWEPRREVIHLVFPTRRGLLPSVRALIDFMVEKYAAIEED
jgi:DNA-binding transcriptional LysR family regulator